MNPVASFGNTLRTMPGGGVLWVALGLNLVAVALALGVGSYLVRKFRNSPTWDTPKPPCRAEIGFAIATLALNTMVAILGISLWRAEVLRLRVPAHLLQSVTDAFILILSMDLGMYICHRLGHHPKLYKFVHEAHHTYDNVNPLNLFVLNPVEVIGFGVLVLALIGFFHTAPLGIAIYLVINLSFGLIGHLGVEPCSRRLSKIPGLRSISTSTFHAEHHRNEQTNFGFYTTIWDRALGTLSPNSCR
jgi:sterol desaturase/sphingolipid hydroxylase (fatty acid hydroxylase superfamily)